MIYRYCKILALLALAATGACERDSALFVAEPLKVSDPDGFARFVDEQQSLAAGSYTLIATTTSADAGSAGNYTLVVTRDDGSVETIEGNWTAAAGESANPASHDAKNLHEISIDVAGGVHIVMEASLEPWLYLLDRNDTVIISSGSALPWVTRSGTGVNRVVIDLPAGISDSSYYAQAYYDAIDPGDTRDLLGKWRTANCFTNDHTTDYGADARVVFRDTMDLGYGRNMYWKFGCDGNGNPGGEPGAIAVFVENFNVRVLPDFPYSTLNLDAVAGNDRQHHFGSNAIEFNTWTRGNSGVSSDNPYGRQFAKFYSYRPVSPGPYADEARVDKVDLDGRGNKAMPLPCIYCHGGRGLGLDENGEYYAHPQTAIAGDTDSKLQILKVDDLEFVAEGQYSRASQEAVLKQLNQAVYCSFPDPSPASFCASLFGTSFSPVTPIPGEWSGEFLRELVQGWYGGDETDDSFPAAVFDSESTLPDGWDPTNPVNAAYPNDINQLFLEVIQPTCLVCHARRGNTVNNDIDFSSYASFIGHLDQLEDYVYDRGIMPLSELGFDIFWDSNQPSILARYLDNFSHFDNDGNIIAPGAPVAVPGPDRSVNVPVSLTGTASQFVESYSWEIIDSVNGSSPTLTGSDSSRVIFDTDMDGDYTLRLTVRQGALASDDTIVISVNSALKAPADLRFTADIVPIISRVRATGQSCLTCHTDTDPVSPGIQGGTTPGAPAVWDGSDGTDSHAVVVSRVNLDAPHDSPFLRKPLGKHHGGATVLDSGNATDLADYHTVLSWITEGAVD